MNYFRKRICGFKIQEKLPSSERQIDLIIGKKYIFNNEEVTLEAIKIRPAYQIKTKWFFWQEVQPYQVSDVCLYKAATNKGSMLGDRWFVVSLENFLNNLQTFERYKVELKNTLKDLYS
jgi:hypothetical protein